MRTAARLSLFLALLCGITSLAQSRTDDLQGVNQLFFAKGSPMPTLGGVNVIVTHKATAGYTCTKVTVRVIDNANGKTLGTFTVDNPRGDVKTAFDGLGNMQEIQVTVDATFQSGVMFDPKFIESVVTTQ